MSVTGSRVHRLLGAFFPCLLFAVIAASGAAPSAQRTAREDPANFDWKKFGRQVLLDADYTTRQRLARSSDERAKYVAQEVGRKLNQLGVMPNTNVLERGVTWKKYGDQALGTCDHVSESLKDALAGSGIDERRLLRVFGEKVTARVFNPFDVNRNHIALAVIGEDGKITTFDLWMHGGEHGTFGRFGDSVWAGLDVESWSSVMRKNGYLRQACDDCVDRAMKTPTDMLQALRDQAELLARVLSAVPRDAVRITVIDSTNGRPLSNASVTVDGAISSPVEKVRARGTTDGAGEATIPGVAAGPYSVLVRHPSCTPYSSRLVNLRPRQSMSVRVQCEAERAEPPLRRAEPRPETKPETKAEPRPPVRQAPAEVTEEQIVSEYRSLLPAVLKREQKPWQTRIEMVHNADRVRPGEYRVNYQTYCLIEQGPDKGKDSMCFEYDMVHTVGQLRTAVFDLRKRLGR